QPRDVAELVWHRRAVEVGAERDVLDPDAVDRVADVGDDRGERRVRVVGAVGADERGGEHDADEPAGGGDRVELRVGEVARRGAQGGDARGRGDQTRGVPPRYLPTD